MKALTVAAVLAAAMLASGSSASADGGKGGKWLPALPAPARLAITWEAAPGPGGSFSLLNITWED